MHSPTQSLIASAPLFCAFQISPSPIELFSLTNSGLYEVYSFPPLMIAAFFSIFLAAVLFPIGLILAIIGHCNKLLILRRVGNILAYSAPLSASIFALMASAVLGSLTNLLLPIGLAMATIGHITGQEKLRNIGNIVFAIGLIINIPIWLTTPW